MFGKHAAFILPAYAITLVVAVALVVWIVLGYRSRQREIARLERGGASRHGRKADRASSGETR
ncbi:MAG: heme exporter protein CcmD [Nitratireductor sp.]|nr:heme exporter protein CcmD [Nitratireductor sp.]